MKNYENILHKLLEFKFQKFSSKLTEKFNEDKNDFLAIIEPTTY